jgi:hypothetical protein
MSGNILRVGDKVRFLTGSGANHVGIVTRIKTTSRCTNVSIMTAGGGLYVRDISRITRIADESAVISDSGNGAA